MHLRYFFLRILSLLLLLVCACRAIAAPPVPYATFFTPGTPSELPYLLKISGATFAEGVRMAGQGKFWVYGFVGIPGARCRLGLTLGKESNLSIPSVQVLGVGNKPLPFLMERDTEGSVSIIWTVPKNWKEGTRIPVRIGAKDGSIEVRLVRFVQMEPDSNGDGVPDNILAKMREKLAVGIKPTLIKLPLQPYTVTQTPRPPDATLDLQTDALFAYTTDANVIAGWSARGYTVWTMGGSRDGKEYADKHPDEVQTTADGKPLAIGGDSFYLVPTPNRIAIEQAFYGTALKNGSGGVCPEEPEYWARAGYEAAFKEAWQRQYNNSPWQNPTGSVEARWKAGQLMAKLQTDHIHAILQDTQQQKPNARRMVALHSPVSYAQWNIVSPQYQISNLAEVQDVIGQVWTGTARTPCRYAGIRTDRTFSLAYLEYSSLYHLLRGTNKRLWFLMDPLEDTPNLPLEDYKSHYEQTLIAALLFPNVDAYEVMPWPERVYGHIPGAYATELNTVIAALQDMHNQKGVSGNADTDDTIGVFVSDSMQWQREAPNSSDFDGYFGLTLPLLQKGVPIQTLSLDRAADPGYLNSFKTLLLSYDFQKPLNSRVHTALSDWVRRGGSLLFVGGSDAYNTAEESWWQQAKLDTPQADLWKQLGFSGDIHAETRAAAPEDTTHYQTLLKGDGEERKLHNRKIYTLDLSPYAVATGSVAVRFRDASPNDGWGPFVASAELHVGGQLAASFQAGSEVETRFLTYDNDSRFNGEARFADGMASWTYQFDNLPRNTPVLLSIDMGNGFEVSAASVSRDFGHTLLSVSNNPLEHTYPRLRIGANYSVTLYPSMVAQSSDTRHPTPDTLYTLRAGGNPIWVQTVGRGLVMNVGVAPGFFSASERSAGFLRRLVQVAHQKAGGVYREAGALRIKRGHYTIVRTMSGSETVEGRTIDLLSPTLSVANDRVLPPRSLALLYDLGPTEASPHIGFVSGRLQAKLETGTTTAFFVRAPLGTNGVARLHAGGRDLSGVRATDRQGRSIAIQSSVEGETLLLRYPNHPDGVLVRVAWK